eukprot:scaffold5058_cov124-Pinguiococcus_pyrenoidosus.AAC.2
MEEKQGGDAEVVIVGVEVVTFKEALLPCSGHSGGAAGSISRRNTRGKERKRDSRCVMGITWSGPETYGQRRPRRPERVA